MQKKHWAATCLLLFGTFLWGSTFVAQKQGSQLLGNFTLSAARSAVATAALFAVAGLRFLMGKNKAVAGDKMPSLRHHLFVGVLCGTALTVASVLQQAGIADPGVTTAQSGFLTALYVIFVPLAGLFFGRKPGGGVWIGCLCGLCGMLLLCSGGEGLEGLAKISGGSICLLLCAVGYTVHILLLDRFSPGCDSFLLSAIQFATMTLLCLPGAILEANSPAAIRAALLPILYAGLLSSGVAYTIQVYTQKILHPALASIVMCFESVFALLCGWAILGERPGIAEGIGCFCVFAGLLAAQTKTFPRLNLKSKGESR